ncbi:hypothetical protein QYF36_010584 [Acer negundo]|nr:hypothetical protein QYF36_010584 [Acer negundo]
MRKQFCCQILVLIKTVLVTVVGLSIAGHGFVEKSFEDRRENHAVKSIQSADGDVIDCIDIYKQKAFDHPVLQDHIIQMKPNDDLTEETMTTAKTKTWKERNDQSSMAVTSQIWKKSGSCPEGTIPVRRIQNPGAFQSNSAEVYGRKKPSFKEHPNLQQPNHSKAIVITAGYRYSGVKADIKVWNPFVESDDEYSTSRVLLATGPYYDFESVESGWAVNPSVYGDRQTRLYAYWTVDASKTTGCFDLTCPGFVQTSTEIALGAAIYPISVTKGLQYQIIIYIYKDPITSNWWVQYGENINIGYWPHDLFGALRTGASTAEWGGEVYSSKLGQPPHTATAMGNGRFADYVFADSGCMKRMRIRDNSPNLKIPEWVSTYADEYNCYDVEYLEEYIEDPELYYGGPGKNPLCP